MDGRPCYIAYSVSGGTLYLVDDAGDAGGPFAGSMQLNGSGSVSNGQCTITAAGSSVVSSGNTLTLTLNIAFKAVFGGNKVVYTATRDTGSGNSGWQALGTWPGTVNYAGPGVVGVLPARSSGSSGLYTVTFSDTNGWQDLKVVNLLINTAINGVGACYVAYVPSGATTGSLFLVDDAGDAGGPYQGLTLPGSGMIQNSQCAISAAGSSASAGGDAVALTLAITFKSAFAGNQVIYAAARSNAQNSGWQAVGTVGVGN